MKILIIGAHFTPAVAVIEELRKMDPSTKLVYVGRRSTQEGDSTESVESKILPTIGVKFISIITGRLQKNFSIYTIISLLKIPIGFLSAFVILLIEKPDVILSFGGYVGVPVVIVAWLFSIPIIIHEQTLIPGLANKISAFFADKIAISFKESESYDKSKTILTGNPVRECIKLAKNQNIKRNLPTILITGGNQGSHIINTTIEKIIEKLTKIANVIHVTGDNKFNDFEGLEQKQNDRYNVKKWIGDEIGEVLAKTDLVICRAGINTLTELAYLSKPALTIPIPYLTGDEQNKNAKFFEKLGLVRILPQSKLSEKSLLENIKYMLKNLDDLKIKAEKAKQVVFTDAGKRIALETLILVNR